MTKAELIAAIADAPDHAPVYVDPGDGVLRSRVEVDVAEGEIFICFADLEVLE